MPRVMKRAKRRMGGITKHHIEELEHGHVWPYLEPHESFQGDRFQMKAAWEELKDQVLASWIEKHPGTRPYAWWEFDAPERRRPLFGRTHPFDNPARQEHIEKVRAKYPDFCPEANRLYCGRLRAYLIRDDFETPFESEVDYLVRIGLIRDEELEAAKEAISRSNSASHLG